MAGKHVYLMRHAQAESFLRDGAAATDRDRRLTSTGELQAAAMAAWLRQEITKVSRHSNQPSSLAVEIRHSPFLRTTQTAGIVADVLCGNSGAQIGAQIDARQQRENALLGDNSPADVMGALSDPDADIVLWVTHQPLISDLCAWMVTGGAQAAFDFPFYPASVATLHGEVIMRGAMDLESLKHAPSV